MRSRSLTAAVLGALAALGLGLTAATAGPSTPGWSMSTAPVPSGAAPRGPASVTGVHCPSGDFCAAVGTYTVNAGTAYPAGVLEVVRRSSSSSTVAPLPADAAGAATAAPTLGDVSCNRPGACVSVGTYRAADSSTQVVIETLSNGRWRAAAGPLPDGATQPLRRCHQ